MEHHTQGFQHIYPMDAVAGENTLWPETIVFTFNQRLGVNFDDLMKNMKGKMKNFTIKNLVFG